MSPAARGCQHAHDPSLSLRHPPKAGSSNTRHTDAATSTASATAATSTDPMNVGTRGPAMYQAAPSSYPGMGGRGARGRVCHQRPHAPVGTASAATVMSTDTISVGTRRPMNLAAPAPLLGMGRRGAGGTMCHQRPHAHLQRLLSLSPSLTAGAHFHPWTRAPPATAGSGPSLYSASCLPPRPRRVSSTPHPLPEPIKPTSCTTHGAGSPDNRPTQRRPHSDTHPATPRRPPAWEPTLTPHSGPQRSHNTYPCMATHSRH